ncbi:MAG: hypothetical protein M3Q82_04035 [Actinomycetota bacterium]|nr:hypothetical protein [Actinomycetota bacterium]
MANDRGKLYFAGQYDASGHPLEYYAAFPARDFDEAEVEALSAADYKMLTSERPSGEKPLYQKTKPSKREADSPAAEGLAAVTPDTPEPPASKKG